MDGSESLPALKLWQAAWNGQPDCLVLDLAAKYLKPKTAFVQNKTRVVRTLSAQIRF